MTELSDTEFEKLVAEAIDLIPEKFLQKLNNVAVVIADKPTAEQKQKMDLRSNYQLLGLYEGVPLHHRGAGYFGVIPDKITIFKKAITSSADSNESLRRIVRDTVWHEVAHHFGMSEIEVAKAEQKRKRRP